MLTREEANILINKLTQVWRQESERNKYLIACVNEFTEKPKREIQVGDIYKDKGGNIEIISFIDGGHMETSEGDYTLDGILFGGDEGCELNLDLSKRYKLVEVMDEDLSPQFTKDILEGLKEIKEGKVEPYKFGEGD